MMIQRFIPFVGTASFDTRALVVSQGTDLTGFAGHNLVTRPSLNLAVCPSAACSSTCGAKVPCAVAVAAPVLRQCVQHHQFAKAAQAIAKSAGVHLRWFTAWRFPKVAANLKRCKNQVSNEQSAYRRPACRCVLARRMRVRQNLCNSSQGSAGVPRSNIFQRGKVCLFSSAVPSRHSLTFRSMGRLHHCSLRHSHAGAPYLGR